MIFRRKTKEKELKMMWEIEKNHKKSYLIGTAHFFPYSFRSSLSRCIQDANNVLMEGPLDQENMAKVREAGTNADNKTHIFDELDAKTKKSVSEALFPTCKNKSPAFLIDLRTFKEENPVYAMTKGMRSWLAFFTIWSGYLERHGWKHSVDYEGYSIAKEMKKHIVFLETIEEQIDVLGRLSHDRIISFLKHVHLWPEYTRQYVECYMNGNLEGLKSLSLGFPSRHRDVIDRRDGILYERMLPYLEEGNAVAFVGAPHVRGLRPMLQEGGYEVHQL